MTPLPSEAPPRDAASLILLRDGAQGLEVLLLRRHENSRVLGGMYVFPGGKLDATDCTPEALATLDQSPAQLHTRLGEIDLPIAKAAGLFLAALRETHEEAGICFATPSSTSPLYWLTSQIQPWSRWITPRQPAIGSARFDTRFFLGLLPPDQQVQHDNHEATEAIWLTPRTALQHYAERKIDLVPPQLMGLAQLARYRDTAEAWAAAQTQAPRCVLPVTFNVDGVLVMAYPGDPRHPVVERAMPGPTRLRYANRHFEPFGGFSAWFE